MTMFDLDHTSFQAGRIGGLKALSCIPVVAGDTYSFSMRGVFNLSPLRRSITMDAVLDLFCFYVRHRHVYGDTWVDFVKAGPRGSVQLPSLDLGSQKYSYLGAPYTGTVSKYLVDGYNLIWNNYFVHPTYTNDYVGQSDIPSGLESDFGRACAHLPNIWNTGVSDDSIDQTVSTAGDSLNLVDLAQAKAAMEAERLREFFAERYRDLMRRQWGEWVTIDADDRPMLCSHQRMFFSGYDIDGTDVTTLGQYSGKSAILVDFRVPRKQFKEHGAVWILALVRYPSIHEREGHYLHMRGSPNYAEITGDEGVLAEIAPWSIDVNRYLTDSGHLSNAGLAPYGQWYRYQPSQVHELFDSLDGYPFIRGAMSTESRVRYIGLEDYDHCFSSLQLGHWHNACRIDVEKFSDMPVIDASIFAGTR